ncbi:11998_t:CDS:2, partial [Acaulospora morrowiae]
MSDAEHNNSPNHVSSQNDTANNQLTVYLQMVILTSSSKTLTLLDDRQLLFQMYPWNKLIKFDPLYMDKKFKQSYYFQP